MKKTFKLIAIFVALVVCAVSCTTQEEGTYLSAVPTDAKAAVKVACKDIYDLTALSENAKFSAIKKKAIKEATKSIDSRRMKEKFLMIVESAGNSGINFSEPVIAAHSLDSETAPVIIAAVENVEMLIDLCKAMGEEDDDYQLTKNSDGIYLFDADEEFLCAFNNTALVIFPDSDFDDETEYYLASLLKNKEICKTNGFDSFIENPAEIAVWADAETLYGLALRTMSSSDKKMFRKYVNMDLIAGSYFLLTTKFNSKSIDLEFSSYMAEEVMAKAKQYTGEVDEKMFKYLPSNACAFAYVNLGDIETILGDMPKDIMSELNDALDYMDLSLSDLPSSLAVAVLEYDKNYIREEVDYWGDSGIEYDDPDIVAVCKTSKKVYMALKEELEDLEQFEMFYNDGFLSIATPAAAELSNNGVYGSDFKKSDIYKAVSGSPISLAVDAKKIALREMIQSEEEMEELLDIRSFSTFVKHLSTVSVVMSGPTSVKFSIAVDETSPESILQSLSSIAVEYAYLNLD